MAGERTDIQRIGNAPRERMGHQTRPVQPDRAEGPDHGPSARAGRQPFGGFRLSGMGSKTGRRTTFNNSWSRLR